MGIEAHNKEGEEQEVRLSESLAQLVKIVQAALQTSRTEQGVTLGKMTQKIEDLTAFFKNENNKILADQVCEISESTEVDESEKEQFIDKLSKRTAQEWKNRAYRKLHTDTDELTKAIVSFLFEEFLLQKRGSVSKKEIGQRAGGYSEGKLNKCVSSLLSVLKNNQHRYKGRRILYDLQTNRLYEELDFR